MVKQTYVFIKYCVSLQLNSMQSCNIILMSSGGLSARCNSICNKRVKQTFSNSLLLPYEKQKSNTDHNGWLGAG